LETGFHYWSRRHRVKHEVEYVDLEGLVHEANCLSDFLYGVEWLSDVALDPGRSHL